MTRSVVGVLRGGTSSEYDLSLKTGAVVLSSLPEESYDTRDILIDTHGVWHMRGLPTDAMRALSQIDVAVNGLHGGEGEDGTVQRLFERAGVPYSGSSSLPSAMSLNKMRAREILQRAGINMPRGVSFTVPSDMNSFEMARKVFSSFGPPYIVKPAAEGASAGIEIATTILDLPRVLADVLDVFGAAVVEEYMEGDDATVGIIERFRDSDVYALPPARIEYLGDGRHIHRSHHSNGELRYIVPSDFRHSEKEALVDMAKAAHRALDLSHFSRADFIVTKHGPYLLEVNAYPGLYDGSAMSPMLESVGSSVPDFVQYAISNARR